MDRELDYQRFATAIAQTAEAYGTQLTPQRIAVYFDDLRDLDVDQVVRAFSRHRAAGEFFPTVAALRTLVLGDPEDRAVLAWERFVTAVRYHGAYASVDFQDPVLHACIDAMGGWASAAAALLDPTTTDEHGRSQAQEVGYQRHAFIGRYRAFSNRLPGPPRAHLPGILEITNDATRGTWDHALDHADEIVTVSEDGKGTLMRKALPGRAPAIEDVSQGKEAVVAITERVLPGAVRELVKRLEAKDQVDREKHLKGVAAEASPIELKSDLGQALDETLNERAGKGE